MVWLVAGGRASCAASIPAVASNLGRITGDGVQVLTLGLYGDFPPGRGRVTDLLSFGRAAGGKTSAASWRWGVASEALSMAYDPSGTPTLPSRSRSAPACRSDPTHVGTTIGRPAGIHRRCGGKGARDLNGCWR